MTGLNVNENDVTLKTTTDLSNTEVRILENGASQRITASNFLALQTPKTLFKSFFTGPDEADPDNTTGSGDGTPRLFLSTYQDWIQGSGHKSEALNFVSKTRTAKSVCSWKLDPSLYDDMLVNPFSSGTPDPVGDSLVAQVFHEKLVDSPSAIEKIVDYDDFTTYNGQVYGTASSSGRANNSCYIPSHGIPDGTRMWLATRFVELVADYIQGVETQHNKSYYIKVLDSNNIQLYRDAGLTDLIVIGQNTATKSPNFKILFTTDQNHGHFSFAEVADCTRQLHTKFAVDYWTKIPYLKITESIFVLSGTGVDQWLVADEDVARYIYFGKRVYAPQFRIGRNSSHDFVLDRHDSNYIASTVFRVFNDTGHFQIGGGTTDRGGQLSVRSTTASDTLLALVDDSTSRSKSFKTEIAKVQTTNNTQTTLWSKTLPDPNVSPNKINILSIKARITVYDITNEGAGTPDIEIGEFEITASARRRVGFTNTKGTSSITGFNNSTGLTTGSFAVDTSGGALRIRVTGETSKTYDFVAKVEYHEYMTP
jgi:hypothetical protein